MHHQLKILLILFVFVPYLALAVTTPLDVVGTILPRFNSGTVSPYRAFNDLMKQSLPLVPYHLSSWGGSGRCWNNCFLTFIDGLPHQYPAFLPQFIWAVAEIPFLAKNDDALANQSFIVKFKGSGIIGVSQGSLNITFNSSTGGIFTLPSTSQSLYVYIYNTNPANPVKNISIYKSSFGNNPPTFTNNFLTYIAPFKLLRTCFWQGQNIYSSGQSIQLWENRPLVSSSTQISSSGVALEHIL